MVRGCSFALRWPFILSTVVIPRVSASELVGYSQVNGAFSDRICITTQLLPWGVFAELLRQHAKGSIGAAGLNGIAAAGIGNVAVGGGSEFVQVISTGVIWMILEHLLQRSLLRDSGASGCSVSGSPKRISAWRRWRRLL